jgi:hypothetical protein
MHCNICGEEVSLLHECAEPPAAIQAMRQEPSPRLKFAPLHYLLQAIAIARWDEKAIIRNCRDNNALVYGGLLWLATGVPQMYLVLRAQQLAPLLLFVALVISMPLFFAFQLAVWGVCHLAARFVLKGKGSFLEIVRILLLGSIVAIIALIPVVGPFLGGLWMLAIMMIAFEIIHGIRRLHAFAISFVVGLLIRAAGLL